MDKDTLKKIRELEKAGFKVQRVVPTERKTFEVSTELLERFMTYCRTNKIKIKTGINEALEEYLKKRG